MKQLIYLILSALILAGCANQRSFQRAKTDIELLQRETSEHWKASDDHPYVEITSEFYVEPLLLEDADKPEWWFNDVPSLRVKQLSFKEVLSQLTEEYGVSVSYHSDVNTSSFVTLQHSGTLGDLIQKLSIASGYSFELNNGTVFWKKYTTRIFDISFLPGATSYSVGRGGSDQAQSQQAQSQQAQSQGVGGLSSSGASALQSLRPQFISQEGKEFSNMQANLSVWQDLSTTLAAIKSPQGQVTVSQASTAVYVRDLPERVRAINDYIVSLNEQLTRQIAIDVQIIEVRMNKGFDYGLNWNLIKKSMGGDGLVSFLSDFSQNQLTNTAPALLSYDVLSNTSDYAGSSLFFNALEEQGQVSVVTSPRVVTLNNQIAEIAITDQQTYLAASTTRSTINVGTDTTLIPGIVTTGLKLFILPKISGEQVLLQISGNLSSLISIDRVESNNSVIETPSLNDKRFFQRAVVPMAQTLMLAGLRNVRKETRKSGLFGQEWLGGSKGLSHQVSEVIVLITPHMIRNGKN